jgi:hypothetical protein
LSRAFPNQPVRGIAASEAFDTAARWLDDEELEVGARTLLEGDHRLA